MTMEVLLAGLNIDRATLAEAQNLLGRAAEKGDPQLREDLAEFLGRTVWSPETLSAAYARISRDPAPVPELRERSRREVEAARRSNENIIFGLGHSSVAEHAVFNFDILGISRLAMESVQHHRLCSFTEKSQRYITLQDEGFVPPEIEEAGLGGRFTETMRAQFADYRFLYERLLEQAKQKFPNEAAKKRGIQLLEGMAKEDARYVLLLATPGQLGMTANARNVELIISRLAAHPLAELREFAGKLEEAVRGIAPSLIKYTAGAQHLVETGAELRSMAAKLLPGDDAGAAAQTVRLLCCPDDGDERLATALLFSAGAGDHESCRAAAAEMSDAALAELIRAGLRRLRSWDPVLRAFEEIHISYELIISASCYAQLKRHRMSTQIVQPYQLNLGITVPPTVAEAGLEAKLREAVARAEELYEDVNAAVPQAAAYALTNAHRRRVLFSCNLRELYHLARLRLDSHAQWDIRAVAARLVKLAAERMPLAMLMACGKDCFAERYEEVFGEPPLDR